MFRSLLGFVLLFVIGVFVTGGLFWLISIVLAPEVIISPYTLFPIVAVIAGVVSFVVINFFDRNPTSTFGWQFSRDCSAIGTGLGLGLFITRTAGATGQPGLLLLAGFAGLVLLIFATIRRRMIYRHPNHHHRIITHMPYLLTALLMCGYSLLLIGGGNVLGYMLSTAHI
jgi:hypothetical protein